MASDEHDEGGDQGPLHLGRRYDEVGPDLGRLYEARHRATGKPALTLRPGDRVHWAPEGDWEMNVLYRRETGLLSVRMEQVPPSARSTELANIFVLLDAAIRRVEDNPRLSAHLASGPGRRPWRTRLLPVAAGLALVSGAWWLWTSEPPPPPAASALASEGKAPLLTDSDPPTPKAMAYPLPAKPFTDQAAAPCKPTLDEVEINGGCWLAMKRSPPCLDVQAEHQGTCYLPVSKNRGRPPQSAQP